MRQGFLIAMVIFGIAIQMIGSVLAMRPMLTDVDPKVLDANGNPMTQKQVLDYLRAPEITETGGVSILTKMLDMLIRLGKIVSFWHEEVWQGFGIYLYQMLIVPLTVSFWVVVVITLRGVGSG